MITSSWKKKLQKQKKFEQKIASPAKWQKKYTYDLFAFNRRIVPANSIKIATKFYKLIIEWLLF